MEHGTDTLVDGMVVVDEVGGRILVGGEDTSSFGAGTTKLFYLCLGSEDSVVNLY